MKKFLVRIFAVIGFILTISIGLGAFSTWYWIKNPSVSAPKAPDNMVLDLDFTYPVVEQNRHMAFSLPALLMHEPEIPLLSIISAIDIAKTDPRVKGIVANFGSLQPSLVHAQEIRAALQRFHESGKFTYAYASSYGDFGRGNRTYYLASMFENIWLQPVGAVGLTGLAIEAPFGKSALEKIGVSTDFMRREEYKSVMENISRDEFSAPVRANMSEMLKNLGEQQVNGIAEARKIDLVKMREIIANGPYTTNEAMKNGLVTHVGYQDEMLKEVEGKSGLNPVRVDVGAYLMFTPKANEPKATIALINGLGMITDAPSGPSALGSDRFIDTDALSQAIIDASKDKDVKAILFRIDSPGGSPSASETIRHALVVAKESKKPIFVSMGGVAASGGYWIAMNADHIVAQPGTLTGSIGVVAGKFVLGGLWDKLGVKWDGMTTSDNAHMWSALIPFTDQNRERVNAMLDDTYKTFITNVSEARKIPLEKMGDVAKGRVWTGDQAVKVGLVDELGGLQTTVMALKKELKLAPTDMVALKPFPRPETPADLVIRMLKNAGFESASLGNMFSTWRQIQTTLAPALEAIEDTGSVRAKLPSAYLNMVR